MLLYFKKLVKHINFLLVFFIWSCAATNGKSTINYTYDGRICNEIPAQFAWKTTDDDPQYGKSLFASLMSDPEESKQLLTGGAQTTTNIYDWNGNLYRQTKNQNNEIVKLIDVSNNCPIGQNEYKIRKIFFNNLNEAPGYRAKLK
jgi:hypothetical protein